MEFILDAAFGWVESSYQNAASESFCEHIVRRTNEEIKDFDIWIPLHQTYVEADIPMGPVLIRTITRDILDERFKEPAGADAETLAAIQYASARERSRLQGCAAVTVKLPVAPLGRKRRCNVALPFPCELDSAAPELLRAPR